MPVSEEVLREATREEARKYQAQQAAKRQRTQERNKKEGKSGLRLVCMSEINPREVQWLWKPYIPLGKLTILRGDPGSGKTSFALAVAAIVSRGALFPGQEGCEVELVSNQNTQGRVLYITAEDDLDDGIAPRLLAADANLDAVMSIEEEGHATQLTFTDDAFEGLIRGSGAQLVICDPIQAFLGSGVDAHRANEVRPVMTHLRNLAKTYGCAIVLIEHLNKNMGGRAIYRGLGSIDVTAAARSILMLGCDEDNPQEKGVAHIKSNCGTHGDIVGFTIDKDGFKWNPHSDITKEIILGRAALSETGTQSAMEHACRFLTDVLSQDARAVKDLHIMAGQFNISIATLRRAKDKLGLVVFRNNGFGEGSEYYWKLPA